MAIDLAALAAAVKKQRQAQPQQYAPGALTLDTRGLMEDKRQFNEKLAEEQRQFDTEAQLKAAQIAAAGRSGGNSGTKSGNPFGNLSQWELKLLAQSEADKAVNSIYQQNVALGAEGNPNGRDPLYYAIKEALTGYDIKDQNTGLSGQIKGNAASSTSAVDSLLGSLGTTADEWFAKPQNADLGKIYTSQKGKSTDPMAALIGGYMMNGEFQ